MNSSPSVAVPKEDEESIYNRAFWLAYAANVTLVTANALTFRFAELVAYLGGTEAVAGTIISVGMTGGVVARLFLGQLLDRYGTRRLWLSAATLLACSCVVFLLTNRIGIELYATRIVFAVSLAIMFTCSFVFIQSKVPLSRRTEVIGALGSSGFVGMVTGSRVGDLIFRSIPSGPTRFWVLFGGAAGLAVCYFCIVFRLTYGETHKRPEETPAAHRLLFRYWPGNVVWVAIVMGIGLTIPTVFLTRFSTANNLGGIGGFFTAYAISAFIFRMLSRQWNRSIGRHRMILMGLAGHVIGLSSLAWVSTTWQLWIPAVFCGYAHALLFPCVVSLGAGAFPKQYRGTGTTIALGFMEVGVMISAPALGWIIDQFGFQTMFFTSGGIALTVGVYYAFTTVLHHDEDIVKPVVPVIESPEPAADAMAAVNADGIQEEGVSDPAIPFPHLGRNG